MSSIFKKLSVILCCLFGLISINPATSAEPGDYLVYFLGTDLIYNKSENLEDYTKLHCGNCNRMLDIMAGQFCCLCHCRSCGGSNVPRMVNHIIHHQCNCDYEDVDENLGVSVKDCECDNVERPSPAFCYSKQYGPFCFINYENGGDFDTVFKNAKNNEQLYCAYCMKKKLNGNFGDIFSNAPAEINYEVPDCFQIEDSLRGKTFIASLDQTFQLNDVPDDIYRLCRICQKNKEYSLKK